MKQTTWSDWETRPPAQFAILARIADYYQVSADYLLGITDDPSPRRGEALPAPVQEVVSLAVAWPEARQQELLAHAQVLNAAQRAANLGEYDRLMAMFAAAEDGPVLVAMIDDLLRAIDAGNAAAVRLLLGRIIGSAAAGQVMEPVGQNSAGDWLQLASGAWIAAALVDNAPGGLPVTAAPAFLPGGNPTPAPASAPTASWRTTVNGIEFASDCPCDQGDVMNCTDFAIPKDGQACFLRCAELVGGDVHGLDRDKDGTACEWKY